jgi:hypothetical protein
LDLVMDPDVLASQDRTAPHASAAGTHQPSPAEITSTMVSALHQPPAEGEHQPATQSGGQERNSAIVRTMLSALRQEPEGQQ